MRKCLAVLLSVALLAALCVPALAENMPWVKVLMSSDGTSISVPVREDIPTETDLDDAVEDGADLIPEDATFTPGRLTILGTGQIRNDDREVYDITFKVWSTGKRCIGLFFRAEDSDSWELITCNLGDVIEGRFQSSGDYVIAVGW